MPPPDGCSVCPPGTVKAEGNQKSAVYPQPPRLKKRAFRCSLGKVPLILLSWINYIEPKLEVFDITPFNTFLIHFSHF